MNDPKHDLKTIDQILALPDSGDFLMEVHDKHEDLIKALTDFVETNSKSASGSLTIKLTYKLDRAKAENEASSAAEVAAAASRAAKLIAEHDVTEDELRSGEAGGAGVDRVHPGRRTRHPALNEAAGSIALVTDCEILWQAGAALVTGLEADREFALYLVELVISASERGWKMYRKRTGRYDVKARRSYLVMFGGEVSMNLIEIANERSKSRRSSGGTDLVPIKCAMIKQYISETFGEVQEEHRRGPQMDKMDIFAAIAGARDGGQVNLNRPIEGANADTEVLV